MEDSAASETPPQEKPKRSKKKVNPEAAEKSSTAEARNTPTPKISDKSPTPDRKISAKSARKTDEPTTIVKLTDTDEFEYAVVPGHLPVSFSTQQTVTLGGLTFALFTKSLQTLMALRSVPSANKNDIFYSLVVLLYFAMLLNFLHAIVLVWLGIVRKDGTQEQLQRAQTLFHMSSFVTLVMILLEICIATLHVHVSAS